MHIETVVRRFVCALGLLALVQCGTVSVGNLNEGEFENLTGGDPCESVDKSFSADVLPIFSANINGKTCSSSGCHNSATASGGLTLDEATDGATAVYDSIDSNGVVNTGDPDSSLLLQKPTAQVTHGGAEVFNTSSSQYETIFCWIDAGAPND